MYYKSMDEDVQMCLGDPNLGSMSLFPCSTSKQKWEWYGEKLRLVDSTLCFHIDNIISPKRQVPYFSECDSSNTVINRFDHNAVDLGDVIAIGVGSKYLETVIFQIHSFIFLFF